MYYKAFIKSAVFAVALGAVVVTTAVTTASAAEKAAIDKSKYPFTVQDKTTRSECGDCHMVFPPNRLTIKGWKKIMSTLSDHFGEDASIDAASVKRIEKYMTSKAMDAKDTVPARMRIKQWKKKGIIDPIRITETPGWQRHHKTKKYRLMSKDVKYERGANCIICHKDAERGMYEEFHGMYGSPDHE